MDGCGKVAKREHRQEKNLTREDSKKERRRNDEEEKVGENRTVTHWKREGAETELR